jgi:mannitol-1-phosphate 5-dehydrogenase
LNERRSYCVEIMAAQEKIIVVENVRAVHANDVETVAIEIASADVVATAVGVNNLPFVYPTIAYGLLKRRDAGRGTLDIIIFENLRNSSTLFKPGLRQHLPEDYPMDRLVGFVETSTDKIVPTMSKKVKQLDPLTVIAEFFNLVYVDKTAFKGEIPLVESLIFTENLPAYFDRKFFTLNMGHALTSYLGYLAGLENIWQAINDNYIRKTVKVAMVEAGLALIKEYPQEFNEETHNVYIENLIRRFDNPALLDTVFRVGRDIQRKLSRNDRLIGPILLGVKHGLASPNIALGVAAGMLFRGKDENGELYPQDKQFAEEIYPRGVDYVLKEVCGLNPNSPQEAQVMVNIKMAHNHLVQKRHDIPSKST